MTNYRLYQTERVCRRQFQVRSKWQKVPQTGRKTMREKEKLPVTSNFSFSHSVFKRLFLQTCKNQGLFGKGLRQKRVIELRVLVELVIVLTLSQRLILDASKLKGFADDNFKFDENGRKFSETIENTEGKEEIARDEQFLLFPQCFLKTCTADT